MREAPLRRVAFEFARGGATRVAATAFVFLGLTRARARMVRRFCAIVLGCGISTIMTLATSGRMGCEDCTCRVLLESVRAVVICGTGVAGADGNFLV